MGSVENEKRIDDEKRVNLGFKVKPALRTALKKHADREKRSLGNLSEVLLEWAYEQLKRAGHTIELMENWRAIQIVPAKAPELPENIDLELHADVIKELPPDMKANGVMQNAEERLRQREQITRGPAHGKRKDRHPKTG